MGRLFLQKLDGPCYACEHCGCHLAKASDLMSRTFHSRNGKAYLFQSVALINIIFGAQEERVMTTGLHEVSDVYCKKCMQICGWRYDVAHNEQEKYKEGKFILERQKLRNVRGDAPAPPAPAPARRPPAPLPDPLALSLSDSDGLARFPHRLLPASVARFSLAARAPHHGYPDTDSDPEACV